MHSSFHSPRRYAQCCCKSSQRFKYLCQAQPIKRIHAARRHKFALCAAGSSDDGGDDSHNAQSAPKNQGSIGDDNNYTAESSDSLNLRIGRYWSDLTLQQKAYCAGLVLLLLLALPKLLVVGLVGVERIIVGSLLFAEEMIVNFILRLGPLVFGVLLVVAVGVSVFRKQRK